MGARDKLYRAFGPKLIEALARVITDEINILRNQHGLTSRTKEQVVNAITSKYQEIPDYDWQDED